MEVASECKHLTRGSGNITYRTAERHDNDDGGHDAGSDVRIGSAVKDLDVRLSGSTFCWRLRDRRCRNRVSRS